jgi:pimeloyl-ACP methyl ester carboxylesterase
MSVFSDFFAYAIQKLVFEPPKSPGYEERQATYVYTSSGLRIATMLLRPVIAEVRRTPPVQNMIDLGDDGDPFLQPVSPRNAQERVQGQTRPLVLYSHGNAEDLGTAYDHLQWLANSLGCDVLAYDYVGYGHSSDALKSEANMYLAIEAMYEHAARRLGAVPAQNSGLFLMGRSLGCTASTRLALTLSRRQRESGCRLYLGLMLVSPLASGFRVLFGVGDSSSALYGMLDRLFCPVAQDIEGVAQPACIMHGRQDDVIDIRNAYTIQAHVPVRCVYPPLYLDAGHNDLFALHGSRMVLHLREFMLHCRAP